MLRITLLIPLTALLLIAAGIPATSAQCILANPSFEMPGSGGNTFGGWNQFGPVGSSADATHGHVAARVSGQNTGQWEVSAYWQRLDTAPNERWSASVCVWHGSTNPLNGQSQAILNIEWRDASGDLISYQSYTLADASTPVDEVILFSVESQPAPPGTETTHFLLGVLQGPTDGPVDVLYDQATFDNLGPPDLDEIQWDDFPGGRVLDFSGRSWRVKGPVYTGPGPNHFCDTATCTWVDGEGRLHLSIKNLGGTWYSTELALEEALGYGDYVFTTTGRLDALHPDVVFGLFIWQYAPCYEPANGWWNPYNEIDIEFSRWGNPARDVGQFVAQPFDFSGNLSRFAATFSEGELTSHAFRWLPDRIEFRSWRGGPEDETTAATIHSWTYTGPHIPRPEQPRVHLNLWHLPQSPPNTDQEVVIDTFTFEAACVGPHCDSTVTAVPPVDRPVGISSASPNPFSSRTTIYLATATGGNAELLVFDMSGRLVRSLTRGFVPAGEHRVLWNGRDNEGRRLAAGVYLYRLKLDDVVETKRLILLP